MCQEKNVIYDGVKEWSVKEMRDSPLVKRVSRHTIQAITFPKGSVRDYFAVPVCAEHYDMIFEAFKDMKYSKWGQSGVCRLHPEWADEIYVKYRTYDKFFDG